MIKLLIASVLISPMSFAQVDPQISVKEFKDLRDEAKSMIKGFDLSKDIGSVGAPDYRFVREKMRSILDQKPAELEKFLISFNDEISDDYNIIQSVKDLGKGKAIKQTADVAKKRFESKARGFQGSYQNALLSFVEKDLEGLAKECLTVLCVNQVREDLKAWFKQAKKMNKPLKLDGVTLARSGDVNNITASHIKDAGHPSVISGKPIAFQRDSNEFKALTDSRLTDELISIYTLPEIQKLTPAQLDRYQNGKIPANLKERYGLKRILALSDAGFKNLMDPLMTQKDLETFKLEDITSRGLIALRRANEKCYEVTKASIYNLNRSESTPLNEFKEMALKNGRTLKYNGSEIQVQNGSKTLWTVDVGYGVKGKPIELKNGNIAIPTRDGVKFFSSNGKFIERFYEGVYFASDLFETSDGIVVAGSERGDVAFLTSNGKFIGNIDNYYDRMRVGLGTVRGDSVRSENGKIIVRDLNGKEGVFNSKGELLHTQQVPTIRPIKFSNGGQAVFEGTKVRFIDQKNNVTSEYKGSSHFTGNALSLDDGMMIVGTKDGSIEVFDGETRANKLISTGAEVKELRKISSAKIEVVTTKNIYQLDVSLNPKGGEIVAQVPCSEEQIRDLTISRKTEKGATKQ